MNDFRVSSMQGSPDWQHDYYDARHQADSAAKDISRRGFFCVVSRMMETGAAEYLYELKADPRAERGNES